MAEKSSCCSQSIMVHPFVLFWLGVLTGAIIIGLIFTYKTYENDNIQNMILKENPKIQQDGSSHFVNWGASD
ncbi:MAG: hypothetical protein UT55_C0013G0002 [Candidatus Peregrinibacteria bacterium GW2011_GWE2_39_6]|nr:MAG: hypothetical protein UT36_C0001G0027 [Candidatus Peregrinibacteria bacterium GW2011_GWF2_39_17]KKR26235.1 MAG: hypothetical protein UT55_C0013G0002 [Candidatus Peregrinibacteria bacterium GW2011_GWE2_39_6]HCW32369.1 hypothetical protein [Candidatus Peregrinibacteria bacterium]